MSLQEEGKERFVASDLHTPTSHTKLDLTLHVSLYT